jgi:hypothetical protein
MFLGLFLVVRKGSGSNLTHKIDCAKIMVQENLQLNKGHYNENRRNHTNTKYLRGLIITYVHEEEFH